jgi:Tfp pilus assembly protein PilN
MVFSLIGFLVLHGSPADASERLEQLTNEQRGLDQSLREKEELAKRLPSLQRRAAALGERVGIHFEAPPEVPEPSATEADPVRRAEQRIYFTRQKLERLEKILREVDRLEMRIRQASDSHY